MGGGEGGKFIEQQQQMIETTTSDGWEFWLTAAGMWAAIISAAVSVAALYLRYRRKR